MMMQFKRDDVIIEKSNKPSKKYMARLKSNPTKKIYFGAIKDNGEPYEQYLDSTPFKLYSKYNHNDKVRQGNYIKRHNKDITGEFNAGTLSYLYLWS